MTVPVQAISNERLRQWLAACVRDHATPLALIAISHDANCGDLHVYRTEDGPSDAQLGALIGRVAVRMLRGERSSW